MLVVDREKINATGAQVVYVDTGKQFPEMYESIDQIERLLSLQIVRLKQSHTFDEYLFERGGMLRQGYTDCSRRMKRSVLKKYHDSFPAPRHIALGFNADEMPRMERFTERNNTDEMRYFFPLIEQNITRKESYRICEGAGFSILLDLYRRMGRSDCFFCPNQRISQARKVMKHYPGLWQEWKDIEQRKGHPILKIPATEIEQLPEQQSMFSDEDDMWVFRCSCFTGDDEPTTTEA